MQNILVLPVKSAHWFTTKNGKLSNPVKKSVKDKPARRTYDGVLRDEFFQIAAKIRAFAVTIIGVRSEEMTQAVTVTR